jgi:hypothetical protein
VHPPMPLVGEDYTELVVSYDVELLFRWVHMSSAGVLVFARLSEYPVYEAFAVR